MNITEKIDQFLNEAGAGKLLLRAVSKYGRTIEFYIASGQVGLQPGCVVFKSEKTKDSPMTVTKCYKTREEADKDMDALNNSDTGKVSDFRKS